ncbi:MAG: hypothetical protein II738_04285 [Clostridia bacterium]|nr:hypothetical protein [Clostridia bacterium]
MAAMLPTQLLMPIGWGLVIAGIALAAVALVLLAVFSRKKHRPEEAPAEEEPAPAPQPPADTQEEPPAPQGFTEPYTPGYVTLDGVDEEDAAVLMAITADRLGAAPEDLCFRSIRRVGPELSGVTDQEAAVLMAVTAYKTGRTPETLDFKSIRLVEE